jgi:ribonucleoside-diphosphate reductase alpha chain
MSIREDVLEKRYYLKDENGEAIEDWKGLCKRVSDFVAQNEEEYEDFFNRLYNCEFLPNTPTLINAGKEGFSLSACYVIPVEDSMEEIFEAVKQTVLIQKSGGGTGFSFSRLRPAGDIVGSTKGIASGPCSFIRVFDTATDVVKQGGVRRGANMGILRCDHPDIMEFISLKKKEGEFSNFNLSIGITDAFIDALKANEDFPLVFKGEVRKTVKAKEIWDAIVEGAYSNGEPGVVFLDTINRANPTPHIGEIEATNPCGEQPLLPYEACVLGSINLSKMVDETKEINWKKLGGVAQTGVRFLDNIVDIQHYSIPEIEKMHKGNRKIGLGVMGWADMLIKLGIPYNSDEALELAEKVMSFITDTSEKESTRLAGTRGVFPNWEGSIWQKKGIKMRNATTTTIAPTGSLSIIAECSSGVEPVFAWETVQKRPVGEHIVVYPLYRKWKEKNPSKVLPPYFVTAKEVSVEYHIKMQAAFQKYTHNAVSKTINLPNSATKEDIENTFLLAYSFECKGVTVYRDGSRSMQVISDTTKPKSTYIPPETHPIKLPEIRPQTMIEIPTHEGTAFVSITLIENIPLEVFVTSPVESKNAEVYDALARIFSIALRSGVPAREMIKQLEQANQKYGSVVSPLSAIVRAFKKLGINGGEKRCPNCDAIMVLEEGCMKCLSCGYSKC